MGMPMNIRYLAVFSSLVFISGGYVSAFANAAPTDSKATERPAEHRFHSVTSTGTSEILALKSGEINRFVFTKWAGPDLPVWVYLPDGIDLSRAPVLFMMHGNQRDPHRYLREWREPAQENGLIVVAPEFSQRDFPKSAGYNLGNVFRKETEGRQDESIWSFSAIEPIFDRVKQAVGSQQTQYSIYGHSAGAQFVHRYLYYKPDAPVKQYIAANAGWYTRPDVAEVYPYGLAGAGISEEMVRAALSKNVLLLLGDKDNDPNHKSLRRSPEAMKQGPHRFARGLSYHEFGKQKADEYALPFGWRVKVVPGVAHSNGLMAKAAAPSVN